MIYYHEPCLSPVRSVFQGRLFTHLTADTEGELLEFIPRLHLRPNWIQKQGTPEFHFDVTGHPLSVLQGLLQAEQVGIKEYVERLKQKRELAQDTGGSDER